MQTEKFDPALISKDNPFGQVRMPEIPQVGSKPAPREIRERLQKVLDDCIQIVNELPASRHNSLVITKIEEAQMWLDKGSK